MSIEFNLFPIEERDGGVGPKRHYKIMADDLESLAIDYLAVTTFEAEHFSPVEDEVYEDGFLEEAAADDASYSPPPQPVTPAQRSPQARQAPQQRQAGLGTRPQASAVRCGICGGSVYDEHASKFWDPSKNRPDWKCRDKDNCGGVAYDQYDGEAWVSIGDWRYPKL